LLQLKTLTCQFKDSKLGLVLLEQQLPELLELPELQEVLEETLPQLQEEELCQEEEGLEEWVVSVLECSEGLYHSHCPLLWEVLKLV